MDTSPLFDQVEIPPIASTISGYSTSTFIFESKTGVSGLPAALRLPGEQPASSVSAPGDRRPRMVRSKNQTRQMRRRPGGLHRILEQRWKIQKDNDPTRSTSTWRLPTAFADGVCRRRLPTAFADGVCFQSKIFGPTMPRCLDTAHRYDNRPMRHRDPRCPQPARRPSPAGMRPTNTLAPAFTHALLSEFPVFATERNAGDGPGSSAVHGVGEQTPQHADPRAGIERACRTSRPHLLLRFS